MSTTNQANDTYSVITNAMKYQKNDMCKIHSQKVAQWVFDNFKGALLTLDMDFVRDRTITMTNGMVYNKCIFTLKWDNNVFRGPKTMTLKLDTDKWMIETMMHFTRYPPAYWFDYKAEITDEALKNLERRLLDAAED